MASGNSGNCNNLSNFSIVSWNVNGIRSRVFNQKPSKELKNDFKLIPEENSSVYNLIHKYNPDIICLQETKCSVNHSQHILIPNYTKYFNESKLTGARSGSRYSGTAIFTKIIPMKVYYEIPKYNIKDGRIIVAEFEKFVLINIYSPNSGTNYDTKQLFQVALLDFLCSFDKNKSILICGDYNMALDTYFDKTKVKPAPGYYDFELLFNQILLQYDFKDSISEEDKIIYTWWNQKTKKIIDPLTNVPINLNRYLNKGWRLDYIYTKNIKGNCKVIKEIGEEYSPNASDHAPIFGNYKI